MPALPRESPREYRTLTLERPGDGVVVLSFLVPEHTKNVLTAEVMAELARALDDVEAGPPPSSLVVRSGRPGSFFAGADIARLRQLLLSLVDGDGDSARG